MDDYNGKVKISCIKRSRKRKSLEFVGWCSKNLSEFLKSNGIDTTNKISEQDVTSIITKYIREKSRESLFDKTKKKKRKTVACDGKLRLLFDCQKINIIKVPDLVEKHYPENQDDDSDFGFYNSSEDDEQKRVFSSDKFDKPAKQVVQKPKGTFAAISRDNIMLLYLRKSLVQELAKTPETFESKVLGTFVRIKNPFQLVQVKNPYQLVQVTGVKEGNQIDGHFLLVTNYSDYLKHVPSSGLSDDDFTQEECEELHLAIKNGCAKRLTVVDMEEKVRSLHEDVTKHWLARELVSLQRLINRASEKGWRRELSEYLDKRELLTKPEEQSRLLREIPEVVAEELVSECVDDDGELLSEELVVENDFVETISEVSFETHQSDKEQQLSDSPGSTIQPSWTASADEQPQNKVSNTKVEMTDLDNEPQAQANPPEIIHKDVLEPPATGITQKKDYIPKVEPIDVDNEPQAQPNPPEIIELSDDDDDDDDDKDNVAYQHYDPKQVIWLYEFPEGKTNGPFSLADLKSWSEDGFFVALPDFKVWMRGNSSKSGVLLAKLLPHIKT